MYFSFSGSRKSSADSLSAIERYSDIGISLGAGADLLVLEERDRARDRLAQHDDHLAVRKAVGDARRERRAAVEVRRRGLESYGVVGCAGEVLLPHRCRLERTPVPRGQEVARLLDRRRCDPGVRRQRHEQRAGARLVDSRDDRVTGLRHGFTLGRRQPHPSSTSRASEMPKWCAISWTTVVVTIAPQLVFVARGPRDRAAEDRDAIGRALPSS